MMKFFTLLSLLVISTMAGATSFLDGCYKTLEINGATVMPGPDEGRAQSTIYSVDNEFYYDLETRKSLRTKILSLFRNYNGGWYTFTNALVFEELGHLEASENTLQYAFAGDVFHRTSSYALEKVDFKTDVKLQKFAGIVTGSIKQVSKALDRNIDVTLILKEVECAE
ncbi:MAG: hypothetical protein ACLGHN_00465 [Bacteriovoracia bacterium]